MTPHDYLSYAEDDFNEGSKRSLVNAFGNVKRAIHFAIDMLLNQCGLFKYFNRSSFPDKLLLLDELRLIPITIMRNLNVERNLVEHEYGVPSNKRVGESIDVARLLLMASQQLQRNVLQEAVVGWHNPRKHLILSLEQIKGELQFFDFRAKGKYSTTKGLRHFSGPFRDMEGKIWPGIKISKKPWKIFQLRKSQKNMWGPILSEIVRIQRGEQAIKPTVVGENAMATLTVIIPLRLPPDVSVARFLDDMRKERFGEKDKHKKM